MYLKKLIFIWLKIPAIVVFTLFSFPIFATDIAFVPARLEGDIPTKNENLNRLDLKNEFAMLASDIVQSQFLVNTVVIPVSNTGWKSACTENRIHYVLKDQFLFPKSDRYSVLTTLYNCKNGTEIQKESILSGYIIQSLTLHYKKLFSFLVRRSPQNYSENTQSSPDIKIFIDANGSHSLEKDSILEFFTGLQTNSKISTILYAISNNKEYYLKNGSEPSVPFSGNNNTSSLLSYFVKFNQLKSSNPDGTLQYILISANHLAKEIPWISLLNQSRQMGIQTVILVPAQASPEDRLKYNKIGQATQSEVKNIISMQTIGLIDGEEYTLSLESGYLYYSKGRSRINSTNVENRKRIDSFDKITSYSMAQAFETNTGKKIIQKSEILTNVSSLMNESLQRVARPESSLTKKLLVSAYGEGFWLYLNTKINLSANQKVLIETEFVLDLTSSNGIRNDSKMTKIHRPGSEYPRLLEYKPSEILNYMKKYKMERMRGYMQVTVGNQD